MQSFPFRRALVLALLLAALPLSSRAQEFRATLTGHVTDAQGGAVPNATVTVKNLETNLETSATTTSEGNYTIPLLQPGRYAATVKATGFKEATVNTVELHTADKATMDVQLEVGGLGETVEVTGAAPLLEADTASRGQAIERERIEELPLNGRNPLNLATLATGVQFNGNPQFNRLFDNGDNVNFSINGGLNRHNEFLLDGTPNNAATDVDGNRTRSVNNIAFVPPVDATEEFKVQTNAYDASYGRTSGGVVNVTIRAGSAKFHGSGYEFARRYQWEANQFGNNARGIQLSGPCAGQDAFPRFVRDPVTCANLGGHKQDQYGFVISGPLLIPRFGQGGSNFVNDPNKSFFLFNFEKYSGIDPAANLSDVPTLLERQGDFSQSGVTVYDPLTTQCNSAGVCTRQPFPGNVIPANRINPVGQAIVNGFSQPNIGTATQRFNNFLQPFPGTDEFHSIVTRVDHEFTQNERVFFRYVHNRRDQIQQGGNGRVGLGIDPQDPLVRVNNGAVLDSVTTLSPRTVLNLRVGFSRFLQAAYRTRSSPFDATALGFPASFSNARPVSIVPRVEFTGDPIREFGPRNPNSNITNTWSFPLSVTHVRGKHSLKFGGEYRDLQVHQSGGSFTWGGGRFVFGKEFTVQNPNNVNVSTQGSAIADLLLGFPTSGQVDYISPLSFHWGYWAGYLQDDFKVTPRLTLNLGLRYDYESPPVERFNRQNRGFALDQANPLAAAVRGAAGAANCPACANLNGGLLFAGAGSQPRGAFRQDRNNWGPRFGAAYQWNAKTVVRGGYGVFYFPQAEFGGAFGFNVTTPFTATLPGGVNNANQFIPAFTLNNPFPGGLLQPVGSSQGLSTFLGQGLTVVDPNHVIPWVHQFSAGVQRELPWRMKLDVAYVGSRTRGILSGNDQSGGGRSINAPTAAQIAQFRQNPNFFNQAVVNPFAGLIPQAPALNGATISRRQLLLPFPEFGDITLVGENVGKLWYDSLQASLEKRLSAGFIFTASYTFSKQLGALDFLNPQDARPAKAVTNIDSTHVLVVSGVYQLPFGRGKRFLGGASKGADLLLGGWEYNWIGSFRSGRPLNLPTNAYLIKDPTLGGASSFDRFFNNCVLQSDGTARQGVRIPGTTNTTFQPCTDPAWALRNTGNTLADIPLRLANLREPWAPQFDMSLSKNFNFSERVRFQLRLETFNTFNTPLFGSPNMNVTSSNFGILIPENSVRNSNNYRQVQLGGKISF